MSVLRSSLDMIAVVYPQLATVNSCSTIVLMFAPIIGVVLLLHVMCQATLCTLLFGMLDENVLDYVACFAATSTYRRRYLVVHTYMHPTAVH